MWDSNDGGHHPQPLAAASRGPIALPSALTSSLAGQRGIGIIVSTAPRRARNHAVVEAQRLSIRLKPYSRAHDRPVAAERLQHDGRDADAWPIKPMARMVSAHLCATEAL